MRDSLVKYVNVFHKRAGKKRKRNDNEERSTIQHNLLKAGAGREIYKWRHSPEDTENISNAGDDVSELLPEDIDIYLKTLGRLVRALAALESIIAN